MIASAVYLYYFGGDNGTGLSSKLMMILPIFLVIEALKKIQIGRGAIDQAYKSDTILWGISCVLIVVFGNKISPIMSLLISAFLAFAYLIVATRITKIKAFTRSDVCHKIFRDSLVLKSGAIIYLSKDFLIPLILTSCGEGAVTKYSFANKFHSVMMSVMVFSTLETVGNVCGFMERYKKFSSFIVACTKKHASILVISQLVLCTVWYLAVYHVFKLTNGIYVSALLFYIALIPLFWIQAFESVLNKYLTMIGGLKSILFVSLLCLCLYLTLVIFMKMCGFSVVWTLVGVTLIHAIVSAAYYYLIRRIT
ncbi:MAG: hypothetical protein WC007_05230 [Pelobacteraceae bacterium]